MFCNKFCHINIYYIGKQYYYSKMALFKVKQFSIWHLLANIGISNHGIVNYICLCNHSLGIALLQNLFLFWYSSTDWIEYITLIMVPFGKHRTGQQVSIYLTIIVSCAESHALRKVQQNLISKNLRLQNCICVNWSWREKSKSQPRSQDHNKIV